MFLLFLYHLHFSLELFDFDYDGDSDEDDVHLDVNSPLYDSKHEHPVNSCLKISKKSATHNNNNINKNANRQRACTLSTKIVCGPLQTRDEVFSLQKNGKGQGTREEVVKNKTFQSTIEGEFNLEKSLDR